MVSACVRLVLVAFFLLASVSSGNAVIWQASDPIPGNVITKDFVHLDPFGADSKALWSYEVAISEGMAGAPLVFQASFNVQGPWTPAQDSLHYAALQQVGGALSTVWQRNFLDLSGPQSGIVGSVQFTATPGAYYFIAWADLVTDDTSWNYNFASLDYASAPTPVPGAVWLMGSGLLAFLGFRRGCGAPPGRESPRGARS